MRSKQSGFTFLELAIVMLVVGLIVAMSVQGAEMIKSSRVKSLAGDFKGIQVALYGYQDRFHALAGDDRRASAHLPDSGVTILDGNGNAVINGSWNSRSGETFNLWQHVRLAGFLQGSTDTGNADGYVPLNASGGSLGVSETYATPIRGLRGNYIICSDNINGKQVKQLDLTVDDGDTAAGSMMISNASLGGDGIVTSSIEDNVVYLACMGV